MASDKWSLPFCRAQLSDVLQTIAKFHRKTDNLTNNASYNIVSSDWDALFDPDPEQTRTDTLDISGSGSGSEGDGNPPIVHWTQIVLPVICTLGIIGNILNLIVLTKKRLSTVMGRLEMSSNMGLSALALSDLCFNVTVLPFSFVISPNSSPEAVGSPGQVLLFYRVMGVATINLFLMTSTWLVVALAIERYIVLFYPLRAKWILSLTRTRLVIVTIYVVCALLTLPYFLHKKVSACVGLDGRQEQYELSHRWAAGSSVDTALRVYILWIWPAIAAFVPLAVLLGCNIRLVRGLRQVPTSRRMKCPCQKVKDANTRITLTLVIIVGMAIVLITPAEVLKMINPYKQWGRAGHLVATLANILQSINFAINFILYCAIDRTFRAICRRVLTGKCKLPAVIAPDSEFVVFTNKPNSSSRAHKPSLTTIEKVFF